MVLVEEEKELALEGAALEMAAACCCVLLLLPVTMLGLLAAMGVTRLGSMGLKMPAREDPS